MTNRSNEMNILKKCHLKVSVSTKILNFILDIGICIEKEYLFIKMRCLFEKKIIE